MNDRASTTAAAVIAAPRTFSGTSASAARRWEVTGTALGKVAIVAALFCSLFWPTLQRLWAASFDVHWSHAAWIPLIGLYYLYSHRNELLAQDVKPAWSGLPALLVGILIFAYGIWPGQNDFVRDFGMVAGLFGVVLLLAGWGIMRIAWFPIALLVCGIPWPGQVYTWVAGPLQYLAARAAVLVLRLTGVAAVNRGTKIEIPDGAGAITALNVAEACAGLRSLMSFVTVAAAVAFLSARPLWQKIIITASAVPIAVLCNMLRVAGQGVLHHYVSPQLSESFAHQFVGMVLLVPAFFMILLVGWILDNLFIDVPDDGETQRATIVAKTGEAM